MKLDAAASAPEAWQRRSIEDVCKRVTSGGTPSRRDSSFYEGGTVSWVKTKELNDAFIFQTEELITEQALASSSAKLLPSGTILLAMYGATVGMLGVLGKPMACNQACCALIPGNEIDRDYLYYQLLAHRDQLQGLATGAAQQNLSGSQIKQLILPFPTLKEQRAIGAMLRLLDDRITLLRETNSTLEAIAQALFKSWFVDFDPVRAKMEGRAPEGMDEATAALFPDAFEERELGAVPRGWRVSPIGDLVDTAGGATPDTKNEAFWAPATHHWTSPKDLSGVATPVLLDTERRVSSVGLAKISSGLLPIGTLLMSSRAPIGYLAITQVPVAINQGYIAMPPGGLLPPLFMLFWCKHNIDTIKGRANGSTFMEISKKAFRPIQAIVPTQSVVQAFVDVANALFLRLVENEKQAQTLATIRDTLLPRLINGNVNIN